MFRLLRSRLRGKAYMGGRPPFEHSGNAREIEMFEYPKAKPSHTNGVQFSRMCVHVPGLLDHRFTGE